jgi:hypothetical protein
VPPWSDDWHTRRHRLARTDKVGGIHLDPTLVVLVVVVTQQPCGRRGARLVVILGQRVVVLAAIVARRRIVAPGFGLVRLEKVGVGGAI